jgi:hypothetical protein
MINTPGYGDDAVGYVSLSGVQPSAHLHFPLANVLFYVPSRYNTAMHPDKEGALWYGFSSAMPARIKPRSVTRAQGTKGERFEKLQDTAEADYALRITHRVHCCPYRNFHDLAATPSPC